MEEAEEKEKVLRGPRGAYKGGMRTDATTKTYESLKAREKKENEAKESRSLEKVTEMLKITISSLRLIRESIEQTVGKENAKGIRAWKIADMTLNNLKEY